MLGQHVDVFHAELRVAELRDLHIVTQAADGLNSLLRGLINREVIALLAHSLRHGGKAAHAVGTVVLQHTRQQNGVCQAVRDVVEAAELMRNAMHEAETRV